MMWLRQSVWTLCTLVYEFFFSFFVFLNFHLPDVDHQAVDLFPGVFLVQMDSLTARVMLLLRRAKENPGYKHLPFCPSVDLHRCVSVFVFQCESDIQSV